MHSFEALQWGRQFDSKGMGGWQIFKGQKKKFRQYYLF
jgi:hypothetical protein